MHSRATYFPSFLRFSLFCTHLFIIASYLVLMRDKGKKSIRRYLELRTRYSIFFLPSFSSFPGHRSSRLTPVTCNQIQGNSKMGKGGDRKREYRSEQWAANWQLSENRFIAPITVAAVCFFFFLLDPLRLNDVSLYHATRKTFLCFAFSCPLLNCASGNIFPRNIQTEKDFPQPISLRFRF